MAAAEENLDWPPPSLKTTTNQREDSDWPPPQIEEEIEPTEPPAKTATTANLVRIRRGLSAAVPAEEKPRMSEAERQAEIARLTEKQQDPLRYAAKQGKTDVSQEDVNMLSAVLAPTAMQPKPAAPQPEPAAFTVGEATPAPDLQSQQLQKRFEESRTVTGKKQPYTHAYDDLHKRDELFKKISKYAEARFGENGKLEEGETKKEFIDRFATHMRLLESGNLINNTTEQSWLNGADPKDVVAAGEAYDVFRNTASFLSPRGGSVLRALKDYTMSVLSDPITLLSAGAARPAMSAFIKTGKKAPLVFVPAIEGFGGTTANVFEQKRDIATSDATARQMQQKINEAKDKGVSDAQLKPYKDRVKELNKRVSEGINVGEAAMMGGLSAVIGSAESVALFTAPHVPTLLNSGGIKQSVEAGSRTIDDMIAERSVSADQVMTAAGLMQEMNVPAGRAVGNDAIDIPNIAMTPFTSEGRGLQDVVQMQQRLLGQDTTNQEMLAGARARQAEPSSLTGTTPDQMRRMLGGDETNEAMIAAAQEAQRTGRRLLDDQGRSSPIAELQIKNDMAQQATQLASAIWEVMPKLAPKSEELISDVVDRTLRMIDTGEVTEEMLDAAITKSGFDIDVFIKTLKDAGLDDKMFSDIGKMDRESVSAAARALQIKSVEQRLLNSAKRLPTKQREAISKFYNPNTNDAEVAASQGLWNAILKLDRNMIVAMTQNMSTQARNLFGPGTGATLGVAKEAIETSIFSLGKTLAERAAGVPVTGSFGQAARQARKDAFSIFFYLNEPLLSRQVAEKALISDPKLMNKLYVTAEQIEKAELYKVVQIMNTPAMMIDKFLRDIALTHSLDKQLSRQGIDLYTDILAKNKEVPKEILQRAVDDALEFTFAKFPTNPVIAALVKGVDRLRPLSTAFFPFARFMGFAAEWTLNHYNPIRGATGVKQFFDGISMAKAGKMDEGLGVISQGAEKLGQTLTGTITVLAAYQWRASNQDTPWNIMRSEDGTEVDIKYLFPLNVPFALADWLYKAVHGEAHLFKMREMIDALIGYKSTVGAQDMLIDRLAEDVSEATTDEAMIDKVTRFTGEFFGQWVGRATVPMKQASDLLGIFMRDETIPRDAYVYDEPRPEGAIETGTRAFTQQVQKGIPILKQSLPEYQPPTRGVVPYEDSGVLKQLTGLAVSRQKNDIEKEIERLSIKYNEVFKTTGDRTLDAKARKTLASLFMPIINAEISSKFYENMEKEAQRLYLKKRLGDVQREAKKYVTDTSIAEDLAQKKSPRVLQQQFAALPPDLKKLSLIMFERSTKTPFNESDDYLKYHVALQWANIIKQEPEIVQKPSNFAVGGMVGKAIKGALKTGAKAGKKSTSEMLDDLEMLATKGTLDIADQTEKAIPLTPQARATEEVLPTPTSAVAPEPTKLAEDVDPSDWEKATAQAYGFHGGILDELKELHPKQYENTVWQQYQNIKDPTGSWKYENRPHKDVGDIYDFEDEEGLIEFGAKDMKKQWADENEAELLADIPPIADDPALAVFSDKALYGSLKSVKNVYDRSDLIAQIKYARSDAFSKLNKAKDFAENDDIVLGVAQGEFRNKFKVEFNPEKPDQQVTKTVYNRNTKQNEQVTTTAAEAFKDEVKQQQSRLDRLRDKYKDTPPVTLYHGAGSRTMPKIKSTGFINPAKVDSIHSELNVPSTSMTRDLNLNFRSTRFGGKSPENYVSVDMPYADYAFSKVNMSIKDYENADLDTIVRAISGDPRQARPVSLPRGTMLEKEDAILEPEKLMINKKPEMGEKIEKYTDYESKRVEQQESLKEINDDINKVKRSLKLKEADIAYKVLRDYLKTLRQAGDVVSTKGGMGHQYQQRIESIPMSTSNMLKIADALEKSGSTERASLVRKLRDIKQDLADSQTNPTGKIMQRALDLSTKFNKGGLAVRK